MNAMMNREVPVYLFTGFLDSGKTTFIQEVMEEEEFNAGERTLLLLCEEGEVEYDPSRFFSRENVCIECLEEESELTASNLKKKLSDHKATRAVIEWNGMWDLNNLYRNLPPDWIIYQQSMFADARTFIVYNDNIRQQTFEQVKGAELVVFNRCKKDNSFRDWQLQVHKICRVANRKNQLVYEFAPDDVIVDDIQAPLPYDMTKKLLDIKEEYFAEWYRDINEKQDDYEAKEIIVKGRAVIGQDLAEGDFIFGRHVMTCCEADITFAGLLGKGNAKKTAKLKNGDWIEIRARIHNEFSPVYGEIGPILYASQITKVDPCMPEVATF